MTGIGLRWFLFAFLAPAATAQRTWIVDAANGPGAHFSDLPPAVAAATQGDRILVRDASPTIYGAVTVTRGLSILGIGSTLPPVQSITVLDVPSGQPVELSALQLLQFSANRVASRLSFQGVALVGSSSPLTIEDCSWVSMHECRVALAYGTHQIRRSLVFLEQTSVGDIRFTYSYGAVLSAEESLLVVTGCELAGTNGNNGYLCMNTTYARPAADVVRCVVFVTGGSRILGNYQSAGNWCSGPTGCFPSMTATQSRVILDPSTVVDCPLFAPTMAHVPSLTSTQRTSANGFELTCRAPEGALAVTFASFSPPGPLFLPEGLLWVDLVTAVVIHAGFLPAEGTMTFSFPTTSVVVQGTALAFQSAIVANGGFRLSMPSFPIAMR